MVVPRYFPDASSALDVNKTEMAEILISDTASRAKVGGGAERGTGRRRTNTNTTMGGRSILQWLVWSLHEFDNGGGIGMVIRSCCREGL